MTKRRGLVSASRLHPRGKDHTTSWCRTGTSLPAKSAWSAYAAEAINQDISPRLHYDAEKTLCHTRRDPFLFIDKRGHWHALVHKMFDPSGQGPCGSWSGGHLYVTPSLMMRHASIMARTCVCVRVCVESLSVVTTLLPHLAVHV